ncbi:hypothetical protein B484DRAFT_446345 [Ochromonadaceae sp. CCMP2298]|nr:hypothetical protein B484DRAFT_446345 [Ochromonadaceae sp. CCMP2298]
MAVDTVDRAFAAVDYADGELLPPLWAAVLPLDAQNYETDEDGAFVVDVWDYLQRMSLYKYMIENVHHCEWKRSTESPLPLQDLLPAITLQKLEQLPGNVNPGSILWGLPLQHGWQYSSGRLGTAGNDTQIDPSAWWADMNYYLSVVPYLGAAAAGLAPPIVAAQPQTPNGQRFCVQASDCSEVVEHWSDFFLLVKSTADSCDQGASASASAPSSAFSPQTPISTALDFNLSTGSETLLASLWNAHIHSIGYALPLFDQELAQLPAPEARFGRSWAGIVDFIAACNFKCDLLTTDVLQNLLPPRVLQEADQPPKIEDITHLQNRAILFVDGVYALNSTTGGRTERLFNCAMCTEEGRAYGREMITLGIYRPVILVQDGVSLVEVVRDQSIEQCTACQRADFD